MAVWSLNVATAGYNRILRERCKTAIELTLKMADTRA